MTGILGLVRLPDVVSILNASFGYASILAASDGRFGSSAVLIIAAIVADGIDGFLARRVGDGPLGIQIDSLADLLSFGVAPAFLAWAAFGSCFGVLGGLYLACGILRLARFNVDVKEKTWAYKGYAQGLTSTMAGGSLVTFVWIFNGYLADAHVPVTAVAGVVLGMALLM
ncbi:MAG TPA: CDP-alcohol phosphatidyltransferase family protein, partial [Methanothrix sp.]|nr:CDP-alcohol phosphatidyltransferase family protein [Methanothrix sp.]